MVGKTSFVYADPPSSVTSSNLDMFTSSQVLVDFQRSYEEICFPPANSDGPVLEFEFKTPKTEYGGTVVDTRNIIVNLELQLIDLIKSGGGGDDTTADAAEESTAAAATDDSKAIETNRPIWVNNLSQSLFQNIEIYLNGTLVSSSNNLHPYKSILEADLSYDPHYKNGYLATQGYVFEDNPKNFSDSTDKGFRRRFEIASSGNKFYFSFQINDCFLKGIDKYLLPGVETRIRLTRALDQFVLLKTNEKCVPRNHSIKISSAFLTVHMLELRNETFRSIEKGLLLKAAQFDYRENLIYSFLISEGTSIYFKDDLFNRAPVSRLIFAMVPEENFTGSYTTNPFNFEDFDLDTVRIIREGTPVGGTPINVGNSHVRIYASTMRALGFDHGGNSITLDNFSHHFCPVFNLNADLHLDDGTIRPELTGARVGIELKFEKATSKPIRLLIAGERRSVVLIDHNGEVIKNSTVYNG